MRRTGDVIARAFELARSGTCSNNTDIQRQLKREGYAGIASHFDSRSLRKQLLALMEVDPRDGA